MREHQNYQTEEFLDSAREIGVSLAVEGFRLDSIKELGYARFVTFKKGETVVEFLFGPPEWNPEMIVYTAKGKFAFEDLFAIPEISDWLNENRYVQSGSRRDIYSEMLWSLKLLKASLPLVA